MNTVNQQDDDSIHPAVFDVMDWAFDLGDLIPALNALMFSDSLEIGGPDLILLAPSQGYSALLIWVHEGEDLNQDQEQWHTNYCRLIESSPGEMVYKTHISSNYLAVVNAIRAYLQPDFDGVTVH